jgi:transposase InsO family protein
MPFSSRRFIFHYILFYFHKLNLIFYIMLGGRLIFSFYLPFSARILCYHEYGFQKHVKKLGIGQSMSRRGNCWDNAPQESFFGHFKDEAYIKRCNSLEELKKEIRSYMIYYNIYRYQWNLKKMTPVEYRNHLLDVA